MKLVTPAQQRQERETTQPHRRVAPHSSHEKLILLACDHFTTERVQEAYAAFRSSPDSYLCEVCGTEQSGCPTTERPDYPDEPPF